MVLKIYLLDELRGQEEQELNSDARLIAEVLLESFLVLELAFTEISTHYVFFSVSFLKDAEFSKIYIRLELDVIMQVSKIGLFPIK